MKFIRDIIAERSESKPPEARPQDTMPADQSEPARPDRTMTRLSESALTDGDEVFKRLLGEDGAEAARRAEADGFEDMHDKDDIPDTPVMASKESEDENLFDDLALDGLDDDLSVASAPHKSDVSEPDLDAFLSEPATPPSDDRPISAPPLSRQTNSVIPDPEPLQRFGAVPGRSAQSDPTADLVAVPAPASGRAGRGAGRVKTRLLGFGTSETPLHDPFAEPTARRSAPAAQTMFPVGWLVITAGPGRGASFALQSGVSQIGRGEDQAVRLDFGDTSISRSNHAAIAYDDENGGFYLGHGGKANMVRLNDRPVLSTEEMHSGAIIRIGETTLRFVALCDDTFSWTRESL